MTHRNKRTRIKISVGVSYGSNEDLVKKVLLESANSPPDILKDIETDAREVQVPFVRFVRFGDSSLDFEFLAWIPDVMNRFEIVSDLHFTIRKKFREHGIGVPYPQRVCISSRQRKRVMCYTMKTQHHCRPYTGKR